MKHVIIKDSQLNGWEYGMLRSFETAIAKETKAEIVEIPHYRFGSKHLHHFGQGMKRGRYRGYFPKQAFEVNSDVAWYILMGPENYKLDLYKDWIECSKVKVLYLFDTLPGQYPLIKKLVSNNTWDLLITSFIDAVDDLEKITGRKWHCVEQGADLDLFQHIPINERLIHFSSYGRRFPVLHEILKDFCTNNKLYYDYTTHDAKHPVVDSTELYRQYAWHLSHSIFTLSWPVELTNPARAGHLNPVTCRWFEAAASGTAILGRHPNNKAFDSYFGDKMVTDLSPESDPKIMYEKLETIWSERESKLAMATLARKEKLESWTWNDRVNRIISML